MKMNTLSKLWRGEYSLAKTYWLFGVVANIVLGIPINLYNMVTPESQASYAYYFLAYLILYAFYNVIASIGLWRSASAYTNGVVWKYISKAVSVIGLLTILGATIYLANSFMGGNADVAFGRYGCANYYAQNESDCNRTYNGTTKFTVDKNRGEVFATNTNINGAPVIAKLEKCVIIDSKNWRCGGDTATDAFPNGNIAITQNQGTQMVGGDISTINYKRTLSNGAKLIQETFVLAPIYKKQ